MHTNSSTNLPISLFYSWILNARRPLSVQSLKHNLVPFWQRREGEEDFGKCGWGGEGGDWKREEYISNAGGEQKLILWLMWFCHRALWDLRWAAMWRDATPVRWPLTSGNTDWQVGVQTTAEQAISSQTGDIKLTTNSCYLAAEASYHHAPQTTTVTVRLVWYASYYLLKVAKY